MKGRLSGRVALITGGTSGIGEATVELFVQEGALVAFSGRSVERGEALARRLGQRTHFIAADVSSEAGVAGSIAETVARFGRLDVLFNNAGGPMPGDVETVTTEEFNNAMNLLLASVIFGIKHAAPIMKQQGRGAIINNSSVGALRTGLSQYLYGIAKAGVTHATRIAGMQLAPHGITVNAISPGGIATPIFLGGAAMADTLDAERRAAKLAKLNTNLARTTPLHRAGSPRDVAYAALFLASDEGSYVNCHDLVVDAGVTVAGKTDFHPA